MKKVWGAAAMLTATVLWGVAFSAQKSGMDFLEPLLFTALRSLVGVAALLVVIMIFDIFREKRLSVWGSANTAEERRFLLAGGMWCGVVLTIASVCQQYGLKYTSPGKTGFLTALYIIIVPVLGILFKRKTSFVLWFAVALAMLGSYILCGGLGQIGKGEVFVILCAFVYSIHILVIDHYAEKCDCIRLSCLQFIVAAVLTAAASGVSGDPWEWDKIIAGSPFWIFCGVGSSAIAFTLQMVSQKYLHPVTATLLMSLESVFAVLGGWLFLNDKLSNAEFIGCSIIFAAIIIAQLPVPVRKNKKLPQEK